MKKNYNKTIILIKFTYLCIYFCNQIWYDDDFEKKTALYLE